MKQNQQELHGFYIVDHSVLQVRPHALCATIVVHGRKSEIEEILEGTGARITGRGEVDCQYKVDIDLLTAMGYDLLDSWCHFDYNLKIDHTNMWLLIDDVRMLNADLTCRSSVSGMQALDAYPWGHLMLDNDLGPNSPREGWQVLEWALECNCLPPHVQLVTSNSAARARMELALRSAGYTDCRDGWRK